jgi:hypothetical protein
MRTIPLPQRTVGLAVLLVSLFWGSAVSANTASAFYGPYEVDMYGRPVALDDLYRRYPYPYIGVIFLFQTTRSSSLTLLPEDGETWVLTFINEELGRVIGRTALTYDAATDCLVDEDGYRPICGLYIPPGVNETRTKVLTISYYTRCIDEVGYHIGVTMNDGSSPPGAPYQFMASRFRPAIASVSHADHLLPELPGDNFTTPGTPHIDPGKTPVQIAVEDDLGCHERLEDGTQVTLENRILKGSGGHSHFLDVAGDVHGDGKYTVRSAADTIVETYEVTGPVDQYGTFTADYTAGRLGVTEAIDVTVTREPRENEPDEIRLERRDASELDIKVPGLMHMAPSDQNAFVYQYGGGCPHDPPAAQYGTESLYNAVRALNSYYKSLTGDDLSYNDASLPFGGLFDNKGGGGRDAGCHQSHRRGIDVDINSADKQGKSVSQLIAVNGYSKSAFQTLKRKAVEVMQVQQVDEPTIHFRVMFFNP